MKRLIALILSVMMVFTAVPQTALASGETVLESNLNALKDYISEYGTSDGTNNYITNTTNYSNGSVVSSKLTYLEENDVLKFQNTCMSGTMSFLYSYEVDPVNQTTFTVKGTFGEGRLGFDFESDPIAIASFTNTTNASYTYSNEKNMGTFSANDFKGVLNEFLRLSFMENTMLLVNANGLVPAHIGFKAYSAMSGEVVKSGSCGSGVTYKLYTEGTLIISGNGTMTNFTMNGAPWAAQADKIIKVFIEEGVKGIGDYAFFEMSNLKTVTIPDSVKSIGKHSFAEAAAMDQLILGDGVETIGNSAFSDCDGLVEVILPNSMFSMDNSVFLNCTYLSKVVLPEGLTSIQSGVFRGCPNLKTVGPIGGGYNIEFGWKTSIPEFAFQLAESVTSVVIPEGVTVIGRNAFNGCSDMQEVTIPRSLKTINSTAFTSIDNLTDIYYGGSAEKWETISVGLVNDALKNATLHTVELKEQEIIVEQDSYTVSCGTNDINLYATANTALTYESSNEKVAIVSSDGIVTFIQPGTAEITITAIEDDDYLEATKVISITFEDEGHTFGEYVPIGDATCTEDGTKMAVCEVCGAENIVDDIGSATGHMFSIYAEIAATCTDNGKKISICDNCDVTDEKEIPNSALGHSFGAWVETKAPTQTTEGEETRTCERCDEKETQKIPCLPITGTCGTNATWSLVGDTLTISGSGLMTSFSGFNKTPWYNYREQITNVVIEEGITSIGKYSFARLSNLTDVQLPSTLTKIEDRAFDDCINLTSIVLPDGLTSIGGYAFEDTAISKITIPASVTSMGSSWLGTKNYSITSAGPIGSGADLEFGWTTKIPKYAFDHIAGLEEVVLPSGVTLIETMAFNYCSSLESITVPATLKEVIYSAFTQCNVLSKVYYVGSLSNWKKVTIGSFGNDPLKNATVIDVTKCTLTWVVDKDATEEEAGFKHEECMDCGYKTSLNTVIPKLPHVHVMEQTTAVEATCKNGGNIQYYTCTKCEKVYADASGKKEISLDDTILDKVDHDFAWIIDKESTEEETGIKHEECRWCKLTRNEGTVIPKFEGILGDVNGDKTVDTSDAQAIFNHFMGISMIEDEKLLKMADVNADESIDTSDAQMVFNMFMGII